MRAPKFSALVVVCAIVLAVPTMVAAQTVVLTAASDRSSVDNNPTDGVADGLHPDADTYLRTFGAPGYFRSAIEFPGVPAGAQIVSATLFLYDGGTVTGGDTLEIHGYAGDGVVQLGSDFAVNNLVTSYVNTTAGVGRNLDVTGFVQTLSSSSQGIAGFMMRAQVEGGFRGSDVNSSEVSNPPTLTIEYQQLTGIPALAPAGATLLIVLLAAAGLFVLVRRGA